MNVRKLFVLSLFFMPLSAVELNPFKIAKRHKAVTAYEKKDYDTAQHLFEELLLADDTDYDSLYNLGKVAYAKNELAKAEGHFSALTTMRDVLRADRKLQAWFDLGNTQVKEQKLKEALVSYQEVLKIDPGHEQAKKMIEMITKLLQEQEKQQQKDQQQKQEQNKDKQDQDKQEQKDQQQQKDQEQKHDQQKDKNKQDQPKDDQQNDKQNQEQQKDQQQQEQKNEQQQKDQQQDKDKQDQQKKEQQEKEQQQQQNQQQQAQEQQQEQPASPDARLDEQEVLLLKLLEEKDAQALKQLLKGTIKKEMPGQHGQKNW